MTFERLLDIIALRLTVDDWHIGDGVDDCAGHDENAMRQSIQQLAQSIVMELTEIEED